MTIRNSHAACDHAATKVARAKCRRLNKVGKTPAITDYERRVAVSKVFEAEYDKLTLKQREDIDRRLDGTSYDETVSYYRVAVAMVEAARKGKCSIAKLTDAKIAAIINA